MSKDNPESTIEKVEPRSEMTATNLISYNNNLLGHVLTIIDSSVPEGPQKNAMKSLIKQSFWNTYDIVWKWMNEQVKGNGSTFPIEKMESVE